MLPDEEDGTQNTLYEESRMGDSRLGGFLSTPRTPNKQDNITAGFWSPRILMQDNLRSNLKFDSKDPNDA
jgi:hypothetical protein